MAAWEDSMLSRRARGCGMRWDPYRQVFFVGTVGSTGRGCSQAQPGHGWGDLRTGIRARPEPTLGPCGQSRQGPLDGPALLCV